MSFSTALDCMFILLYLIKKKLESNKNLSYIVHVFF